MNDLHLRAIAVAVLVGVAAPATAAQGAKPSARITYAVAGRAYLDKGTADGLAQGATLELLGKRRRIGTCVLDQVFEHRATCAGAAAASAERVALPTPSGPPPVLATTPHPPLPTPPSAAELAASRALIAAAPVPQVRFRGTPSRLQGAVRLRADVALTHRSWVHFAGRDASFHEESIDAAVRGVPLILPGLSGSAALRVVGDLVMPAAARSRAAWPVRLYVWDTAVSYRRSGVPFAIAAGRFRPTTAPGMPLLDGAQAGLVLGGFELGAYGGTIPDPITTMPGIERSALGAYSGLTFDPIDGVLVHGEARFGVLVSPRLAVRAEGEALGQVLFGRAVQASAAAKVGVGGTNTPLPSLDGARADVSVEPGLGLRFAAGYRYRGAPPLDLDLPAALTPIAPMHHADADVAWTIFDAVTMGVFGGAGYDVTSSSLRGWVGPTVSVPRLFTDAVAVDARYAEELGAYAGRSTAGGATWTPFPILRLRGEVVYSETVAPFDPLREVALLSAVEAPLFTWCALRAGARTQVALPALDAAPRATPVGLVVDAAVSGSF